MSTLLLDFGYYRDHVIFNPGSLLTNYQYMFVVNTGSGTPSSNTLYLNGHSNSDLSDLRFTNGIDDTLFDYWIESTSNPYTVWVEIPSLPSGYTTIRVYYGKPTATPVSDGSATFDFFDDFPGSSVDANKWTVALTGGGTVSVGSSMLSITTGGSGQYPNLTCKTDVASNNMIVESKVKRSAGSAKAHFIMLVQANAYNDGISNATDESAFGDVRLLDHGTAWDSVSYATYPTNNVYFILSAVYDGTNLIGWYNRSSTRSWARPTHTKHIVIEAWYSSGTGTYQVDWVLQRKYASNPPTSDSWGSEIANVSYTTLTKPARHYVDPAEDPMYPGKINSPPTTLTDDIDEYDSVIPVDELSVFPDAPNTAVIGADVTAETIQYNYKSAASGPGELSGCTRGFQGTAKPWSANTIIGRNFTAYDYDTLRVALDEIVTPPINLGIEVWSNNISNLVTGVPISFSAIIESRYAISTYDWDFGDGTSSTDASPVHAFSTGNYTVTLTVTDTHSNVKIAMYTLAIVAAPTWRLPGGRAIDDIVARSTNTVDFVASGTNIPELPAQGDNVVNVSNNQVDFVAAGTNIPELPAQGDGVLPISAHTVTIVNT